MTHKDPSPIQQALNQLVAGNNLSEALMRETMTQIMTGDADPAAIGGLLIGLRLKGENVDEIASAAQVMREFATPVSVAVDGLTDIVGTGGDGASTFNVSTTSAFVAASAGVRVAKHGNRSVSSQSGAADVLEAAGCRLDIDATQAQSLLEGLGVAFLFAPQHHGAMRHAIGPRRALGCWSLFNLLGPLTNPAQAENQVLGVFSPSRVGVMAEAMKRLGARHVLVVSSDDGLDEISPTCPTHVAELKDGQVVEYTVDPASLGWAAQPMDGLKVTGPEQSLAIVQAVLAGQAAPPARQIVAFNAGAAIYVAGQAASLQAGIQRAFEIIDSGQGWALLQRYADATQSFGDA